MSARAVLRCLLQAAGAGASIAAAAPVVEQSFVVSPELWDRPRSAVGVRAQPAIRDAVRSILGRPEARLVVRHGPLQESRLAAEELRSWLAALAVDAARVSLEGGLQPREPLRLEVIHERPSPRREP